MPVIKYRQYILNDQVSGEIDLAKTFSLKDQEIDTEKDLKDGQTLIKVLYISNDPAQRTWIDKDIPDDRHYQKKVEAGNGMQAGVIGRVVSTKGSKFSEGDLVQTMATWSEYAIVNDSANKIPTDIDPAEAMALGLTALTAYCGLLKVGEATSNDKTIVVSAAAGATGSTVCQIAKNVLGCKKVIGIAGSAEKCKLIKEKCGVDIALNYKDDDFEAQFVKATPDFIDVYYDNVGAKILEMSMDRMARNGRIVACGAIDAYDKRGSEKIISPATWFKMTKQISMRIKARGFLVMDFKEELGKASKDLYEWARNGKLDPLRTVWEAKFEDVPQGMIKLMKGENQGKLVTKVKWDDEKE